MTMCPQQTSAVPPPGLKSSFSKGPRNSDVPIPQIGLNRTSQIFPITSMAVPVGLHDELIEWFFQDILLAFFLCPLPRPPGTLWTPPANAREERGRWKLKFLIQGVDRQLYQAACLQQLVGCKAQLLLHGAA